MVRSAHRGFEPLALSTDWSNRPPSSTLPKVVDEVGGEEPPVLQGFLLPSYLTYLYKGLEKNRGTLADKPPFRLHPRAERIWTKKVRKVG